MARTLSHSSHSSQYTTCRRRYTQISKKRKKTLLMKDRAKCIKYINAWRGQIAIVTIHWFKPEGKKKIVFNTFICQRCSLRTHPFPFRSTSRPVLHWRKFINEKSLYKNFPASFVIVLSRLLLWVVNTIGWRYTRPRSRTSLGPHCIASSIHTYIYFNLDSTRRRTYEFAKWQSSS